MNAPVKDGSLAAPSLEDDPCFRYLIGQTHKSDAMRAELTACCSNWVKAQTDYQRRAVPVVGLSNERLIEMGHVAGIAGVHDENVVRFGRMVLGAATHPTGAAPPPLVSNSALRKIETMNTEARILTEKLQAWSKCATPMMETLKHLSEHAPDEATRKEAADALARAYPKKGQPW